MQLLLIDNYDSFTYNLYQQIRGVAGAKDCRVEVERNDSLTVAEVRALNPDGIVLSPGPGSPADSGICRSIIDELAGEFPILGVCLGHQVIVEQFGGQVSPYPAPLHGKTSSVTHFGSELFKGVPSPFKAARYHSLAAESSRIPACLEVTCLADDSQIMGIKHQALPIWGIQFHPESFLSESGDVIIQNFIEECRHAINVC